MVTYRAPLDDIRFNLYELWDYDGTVATLPGYAEATREVTDVVLEEVARFCTRELLPLNSSGDHEGCTFEQGRVCTPAGFKEAYQKFVEGGWTGLACDGDHGGQGLPQVLQVALQEMVCSTNLSFGIYPGLSYTAYRLLALHGGDEQKKVCLPRLANGSWSGTMCLTEPQCGTDLGLVRTRAEPAGTDLFKITGTKIFISAGEHDLTENILHLVLARLPGEPAGTEGLSLFLVSKFQLEPGGVLGEPNGISCSSIEHKMGLKASSTCVMNFDGAAGYLVGEPRTGMRTMFTMMNEARLSVGMQGLGLAETAYQSAVAYARERLQGRSVSGPKYPDKPADPIIVHPGVRKSLLTMRALNESARALALWIGIAVDVATKHPDPVQRCAASDLVALMTPIIKAFFTDHGFEATNLALQIFGGHGYIRDTGMEQLVRDARIGQIYEGTNGVQALDLVGRKLPQHSGRLLRRFFHPVCQFIEDATDNPDLEPFVTPLSKAVDRLQRATLRLAQQSLRNREEAAAAASDYLHLFALVALAYIWARTAKVALPRTLGEKGSFYGSKVANARFYMSHVLPLTSSLFAAIMAGAKTIVEVPEEWF